MEGVNTTTNMTTLLGLLRDFAAALIGVLILFGVDWTQEQVAGVLLLVTVALALASWVYEHKGSF